VNHLDIARKKADAIKIATSADRENHSAACARRVWRPRETSFTDSGNEIWEYDFSRMHAKPINFVPYVSLIHSGAEGDKKSLVIFFDRSKIVQQYTISSSKVDVSQGLIAR
jgi:hypothetical protein